MTVVRESFVSTESEDDPESLSHMVVHESSVVDPLSMRHLFDAATGISFFAIGALQAEFFLSAAGI